MSIARRDGALADFTIPFLKNSQDGAGSLQPLNRIVAVQDQRRQMPAVNVAQAPRWNVIVPEKERGERAFSHSPLAARIGARSGTSRNTDSRRYFDIAFRFSVSSTANSA